MGNIHLELLNGKLVDRSLVIGGTEVRSPVAAIFFSITRSTAVVSFKIVSRPTKFSVKMNIIIPKHPNLILSHYA